MIISDAQYKMQGRRSFLGTSSFSSGIIGEEKGKIGALGLSEKTDDSFFNAIKNASDGEEQKTSKEKKTQSVEESDNDITSLRDTLIQQLDTIQYLLRILLGKSPNEAYEQFSKLGEEGATFTKTALSEYGYSAHNSINNSVYEYGETESMSFSTMGRVITGDGREIDFNIEVAMSRSFYQRVEQNVPRFSNPLMDPLVVHLEGDPVGVSDQKFYFDLDGDGSEEEMSNLMAGSAFLALDKNEDGMINDGNELFGTKSGNGFADLAGYDSDDNGWIDEADEIFDKLKVFTVGSDGSQKLVSLKDAGIGAINLGSQEGDFSVKDISNNTHAMIRRSGFFLYENGMPGLMHQMDFAVSKRA
ncbi:MAG: hypothetical protein K6F00_02445 [Lachnospiraceae bacterium]|nr:hypothetical protein [Lachnospiraceae bacterium]